MEKDQNTNKEKNNINEENHEHENLKNIKIGN